MSPRISNVPLIDPTHAARSSTAVGGTTSATGLPNRVIRTGFFVASDNVNLSVTETNAERVSRRSRRTPTPPKNLRRCFTTFFLFNCLLQRSVNAWAGTLESAQVEVL